MHYDYASNMDDNNSGSETPNEHDQNKPTHQNPQSSSMDRVIQPSPELIKEMSQDTNQAQEDKPSTNIPLNNDQDNAINEQDTSLLKQESIPKLSIDTPPAVPITANSTTPSTNNTPEYLSNPYLNSVRGLVEILQTNPDVSMLASLTILIPLILLYLWFFGSIVVGSISKTPILSIVGGVSSFIGILLYGLLVSGVMGAVASESINREHTTIGHVWHMALSKLFPLIGLSIICGFISIFAYALLIIPGLIFTSRASLSFLLLFEEDLGPIEALKRSFELTKYHTFEMLASIISIYLMTGGYSLLTTTAVSPFVGRYEDLKRVYDAGQPKQPVHWLNYLTALLGSFGLIVLIGLYAFVIITLGNNKKPPVQVNSTKTHRYNFQSALNDPNTSVIDTGITSALAVGNSYLQDLTDNNPQAAYALETTGLLGLQTKATAQNLETAYRQWNIAGYKGTLTNLAYVEGSSGEPAISMLDTYNVPNGPFYVRIVAEYLNSSWQIGLVQGSTVKIFP